MFITSLESVPKSKTIVEYYGFIMSCSMSSENKTSLENARESIIKKATMHNGANGLVNVRATSEIHHSQYVTRTCLMGDAVRFIE